MIDCDHWAQQELPVLLMPGPVVSLLQVGHQWCGSAGHGTAGRVAVRAAGNAGHSLG